MKEKFETVVSKYVPVQAVSYSVHLWEKYRFSFKVTRERKSKLGDYRFHKSRRQHIITVNGNLNPYGFLITFIHEIAHLVHYEMKGNNQPPHGIEWKKVFRELMTPVMNQEIFPPDLLKQLSIHMKNPKASSASDHRLSRLIRKYDTGNDNPEFVLEDMSRGDFFMFNGRIFEKGEKRRTRSLCVEIRTGKRYLVSEMARVERVDKKIR